MSTSPPPRSWLAWGFPLTLVLLSAGGLSASSLWQWADLDPTPIPTLMMAGQALTLLCWVTLLVWFLFFSRFAWKTRFAGLGLLALLVGAGFATIDEVVVDAKLFPHPRFRWQPRPQDRLASYLQEESSAGGLPSIDLSVDPVRDFPRYRGAHADGVVHPTELLDAKWEGGTPVELWRHPCGGGFAGFAVAGNVLVTVEQRGADEVVVCYDQKTGKQRWLYSYPASFRHPVGSGPRATPAIADGEVYSLGAMGDLVCLDGVSGSRKWSVNILKDNEAVNIQWGLSGSPLVAGDLVIVNAGINPDNNVGRSLAAYDRKSGQRVWGAGKHRAGYGSPHLATLGGRQQVLLFDAGGIAGFDVKTGEELWQHPWEAWQDMNIVQPILPGDDRVFISSEPANGCAMLKVTQTGKGFQVAEVWANKSLAAKQANPVKLGNAIFGLHLGALVCLDVDTGKRYWRGKSFGQGQMLGVAGTLLILSEPGELVAVAADRRKYTELGRMKVFDAPRTWNTPALAGRLLFLRNDVEMVCYELPVRE